MTSKYKKCYFSVWDLNWEVVFLPTTHVHLSKFKSSVIFTKMDPPWALLCVFSIQARKKFGPTKTHEKINFRPTKHQQEKILNPRNTREKKFWTHKVTTWKNFGATKYPNWNNHERTMARNPQNLARSQNCESSSFLLRF